MQVVILCGGRGTRLGSETEILPKPIVPIGEHPILWHIMRYYAHFGHSDFILCLGYKGEIIRDYFLHYDVRQNDLTIELGRQPELSFHSSHGEPGWRVTLANTGLEALTGTRVKRIEKYIRGDTFMLTYGDGLASVDLHRLLDFHNSHGKAATVTAVHPPARFGELTLAQGKVTEFSEKPQASAGLINGGFLVLNRKVFDYLPEDEECALEHHPMANLTRDGQLMAYEHRGFWQCMDTIRELGVLRKLWDSQRAPWRVW